MTPCRPAPIFSAEDLLLAAVAEAVNHAGDHAKIVLALDRARRVAERGALIVPLEADGERSEQALLDSSTHGIGRTSDPAAQIVRSAGRDSAADAARADQAVN